VLPHHYRFGRKHERAHIREPFALNPDHLPELCIAFQETNGGGWETEEEESTSSTDEASEAGELLPDDSEYVPETIVKKTAKVKQRADSPAPTTEAEPVSGGTD